MKNEMIISIIIIGIVLIYAMPNQKIQTENKPNVVLTPAENVTYNISLSILPLKICTGQSINGKIKSNMPNQNCVVYYRSNLMPFFMKQNIQLDSLGNYQGDLEIDYPVKAYAYVECSEVKSNEVQLEVINC